jgi:hypothetical protein
MALTSYLGLDRFGNPIKIDRGGLEVTGSSTFSGSKFEFTGSLDASTVKQAGSELVTFDVLSTMVVTEETSTILDFEIITDKNNEVVVTGAQ